MTGDKFNIIIENCNGKQACIDTKVQWALLLSCNDRVSDYVSIDYTCESKGEILPNWFVILL